MKAVVAAFNQEKALVGALSVIVQPVVEPMDHFTALNITAVRPHTGPTIIVSARAVFLCRMSQGEYLEYQFHL